MNHPITSILRHVLPDTRVKLSSATFERLRKELEAKKSNLLTDDSGELWHLSPKTQSYPYFSKVQVHRAVLYQTAAEEIAFRLNGNKFCHAYYQPNMIYEMNELHEVMINQKKAFLVLHRNIQAKRPSFNFNFYQPKENI